MLRFFREVVDGHHLASHEVGTWITNDGSRWLRRGCGICLSGDVSRIRSDMLELTRRRVDLWNVVRWR